MHNDNTFLLSSSINDILRYLIINNNKGQKYCTKITFLRQRTDLSARMTTGYLFDGTKNQTDYFL